MNRIPNPSWVAGARTLDDVRIVHDFGEARIVKWLGHDGSPYEAKLIERGGRVGYVITSDDGERAFVKKSELLRILYTNHGEPYIYEESEAIGKHQFLG